MTAPTIVDVSNGGTVRGGTVPANPLRGRKRTGAIEGVVFHHSAGTDLAGAMTTGQHPGKQHGTGAQFYIDRDGTIYRYASDTDVVQNVRGSKFRTDKGPTRALKNNTVIGIEVIATNSQSFTPAQKEAALQLGMYLASTYSIPASMIVGHGELQGGPGGNKLASEGVPLAQMIRDDMAGLLPPGDIPDVATELDVTPTAPEPMPLPVFRRPSADDTMAPGQKLETLRAAVTAREAVLNSSAQYGVMFNTRQQPPPMTPGRDYDTGRMLSTRPISDDEYFDLLTAGDAGNVVQRPASWSSWIHAPDAAPAVGAVDTSRVAVAAPAPTDAAGKPGVLVQSGTPETGYDTILTLDGERQFQAWKARVAPNDNGLDYDFRGAFAKGIEPDPQTGHWPDTFKKPAEPTFSVESQYAKYAPALAGRWEGDTYIPPKLSLEDRDAAYAAAHPSAPVQPTSLKPQPTAPGPVESTKADRAVVNGAPQWSKADRARPPKSASGPASGPVESTKTNRVRIDQANSRTTLDAMVNSVYANMGLEPAGADTPSKPPAPSSPNMVFVSPRSLADAVGGMTPIDVEIARSQRFAPGLRSNLLDLSPDQFTRTAPPLSVALAGTAYERFGTHAETVISAPSVDETRREQRQQRAVTPPRPAPVDTSTVKPPAGGREQGAGGDPLPADWVRPSDKAAINAVSPGSYYSPPPAPLTPPHDYSKTEPTYTPKTAPSGHDVVRVTTKQVENPDWNVWNRTYGPGSPGAAAPTPAATAKLEDIHDARDAATIKAQTSAKSPVVPPAPPRFTNVTVKTVERVGGSAPTPRSKPVALSTGGYTVRAGDSLSVLARANHTTVDAIAKANNISDPNKIRAGQQIIIPGRGGNGTAPSSPSAAQNSAAVAARNGANSGGSKKNSGGGSKSSGGGQVFVSKSTGQRLVPKVGTFYNNDTGNFEQRTVYVPA